MYKQVYATPAVVAAKAAYYAALQARVAYSTAPAQNIATWDALYAAACQRAREYARAVRHALRQRAATAKGATALHLPPD